MLTGVCAAVAQTQFVTQPLSSTSLTVSPTSGSYGAAFTITAVLTPPSGGPNVSGGTVTFSIDGIPVCGPYSPSSANNPPGVAANASSTICSIAAGNPYALGTRKLTADYTGDSNYSQTTLNDSYTISGGTTTTTLYMCVGPTAGCSASVPHTVTPRLTAPLSMIYGQIWNGVANVTPSDSNPLPGNTVITWSLNGGSAQPICLIPTAIKDSPCPSAVGTTLGTSVGTNVITASYVPGTADTIHTGSSSTVTVYVSQDPGTSVVVTAGSSNSAMVGTAVTLTATVSGTYAAPTGTVTFWNGNTPLCSSAQTLTPSASGVTSSATCTTTSLPVGKDAITASYAATTNFAAANSAAYSETITPPLTGNFNISVTPNPVSLGVGYGTLLTVTVAASSSFAQDVTLSCGNLPSEASCTFTPSLIHGGRGTTTVFLNTAAPHSCGTNTPYFVGRSGGGGGLMPIALPALAGLIAIFIPGRRRISGRRRWLRALVAMLLTAGVVQITGCSLTCTDLGTKPGTYTFQVTGTAAGSGEVESQDVTLTVSI
jgi:hypothetical protein